MNLSQGGENALKKVSLAGPVLHPFLAYVLIVLSKCLFYQQKMEELIDYYVIYVPADGHTRMFLKASLKISCYLAKNSLHQRRDVRRYLISSLMKVRKGAIRNEHYYLI